jgi:hypothetical protein
MTLPVLATVFDNIDRTWRARQVVWHYAQVPVLLTGLLACAAIALYLVGGEDMFFKKPGEENEKLVTTGWYVTFQFLIAYGTLFALLPFCLTWTRYVTAGPAGLQGRTVWQYGSLEWGFIRSILLTFVYLCGIGLGVAAIVIGGTTLVAALGDSAVGTFSKFVGYLAIIFGYVWFLMIVIRATAAFIPVAFGHKLDFTRALRVTKRFRWRLFFTYLLACLVMAIPLILIMVAGGAIFGPTDPMTSKTFLLFQLFQPFILLPVNIFFWAVLIAIYADVWRMPEANAEWPVADFPLVAAEAPQPTQS